MTSYKEAYKYPFIAAEILSSKNRLIVKSLLNDNNDENKNILNLIKVLDNKEILNTTLPGYINKIISSHMDNELFCDILMKNNNIIFDILFKYVYNDSYRDLCFLIINENVKKGKKDYYDFIPKIFEQLLIYMNKYISEKNKNNENLDNLIEIKDVIKNLIYILIKLAEDNKELFDLIVKKLSEGELLKNLKTNLKEIDDDEIEEENNSKCKNNINAFYCINKLSIIFSNLFNIILAKNENDKYAFYKYNLSTIIEPIYSPYNYVPPSSEINVQKENEESNNDTNNKEVKTEIESNIKILIDSNIYYIKQIYSIYEDKIEIIDNISRFIIFSTYNKITDNLILMIVTIKKDYEKINNFLNDILIDLIQLIIDYPYCSIIHNKTLKIFQLIIEYNLSIKKDNIIKFLKTYFNDKRIDELISEEGVILNDRKESNNNIYLINILNLLEKQDDENIVLYLEKNNQGLYENEKMAPEDYIPKPDEEEIIMKKKEDIHDSEAFIFTPKKTIEDSKKIMKNLKELDV